MVTDSSPVKDYYPVNFETDLNGKLQEWEAVVLIPFIDEVAALIVLLHSSSITLNSHRVTYLCYISRII